MRINTKYEAIIELDKFLKKVFANLRKACYYKRADKATRRYLSWIEGLTTNQYVGGSNPSRRTTYMFKPLKRAAFLFLRYLGL